jgi:hypothetical protein
MRTNDKPPRLVIVVEDGEIVSVVADLEDIVYHVLDVGEAIAFMNGYETPELYVIEDPRAADPMVGSLRCDTAEFSPLFCLRTARAEPATEEELVALGYCPEMDDPEYAELLDDDDARDATAARAARVERRARDERTVDRPDAESPWDQEPWDVGT